MYRPSRDWRIVRRLTVPVHNIISALFPFRLFKPESSFNIAIISQITTPSPFISPSQAQTSIEKPYLHIISPIPHTPFPPPPSQNRKNSPINRTLYKNSTKTSPSTTPSSLKCLRTAAHNPSRDCCRYRFLRAMVGECFANGRVERIRAL